MIKKINIIVLLIITIQSCTHEPIENYTITAKSIKIKEDSITKKYYLKILEDERKKINDRKTKKNISKITMRVQKNNPKKIYVHYMPWFQSKEHDGYWGQHWTMVNKNPDNIDENNKREIASYYYPLIGPYSSIDPDLQEYHFLLMKLSGIDGVIFDWYGSENLYDYELIKNSTETFMNRLEDLGLTFSIMYEDRVAQQAVDNNLATHIENQVQKDFNYIKNHYFTKTNFLKTDNKNTVFIFGPDYLTEEKGWNTVLNSFSEIEKPKLFTIWGKEADVGQHAGGEFLWIAPDHLEAHKYYYKEHLNTNKTIVGSAYPGFKSFYQQGGWGLRHDWEINNKFNETFIETLNYTHNEQADFIQIATWNDFGEGTMIEPTEEMGYTYLSILQQYTGVEYSSTDLELALRLYKARKKYSTNNEVQDYLNSCYIYIKQLNFNQVDLILNALNTIYI